MEPTVFETAVTAVGTDAAAQLAVVIPVALALFSVVFGGKRAMAFLSSVGKKG